MPQQIISHRFIIFLLVSISTCSCLHYDVGDINFDFANAEPKIILNGLLTPSDSIFVSIHKARSILDKNTNDINDGIGNATVVLKNIDNQQVINLKYLQKNGIYGESQQKFKILAGHRYAITVTAPNYPAVTSECKIPIKAAISSSFNYSEPYKETLGQRRRVEARWYDVSDKDSLNYGIVLKSSLKQPSSDLITPYTSTVFSENITKTGNLYFYQTDALNNEFSKNYTLLTVEKTLYQYYLMAEKMDGIAKSASRDFFGAFQGVVPEYTNIKGGYGVFGGYLSSTTVITFK